ncbi:dihydrofolate reductase family protein [Nonomuraea thailandensis]
MSDAPLRLYMAMSVDGFIAGPDDREGQELGRDGGRLFNWLDERMSTGIDGQVYREAMDTGAVISGRRTFELAGRWNGDHHDGVPICVLTHHADADDVPPGSATFHTDVDACAAAARTAARDRAVLVHGAGAARALLAAGQLDEIELHLVPVLLGGAAGCSRRRDSATSSWSRSAASRVTTPHICVTAWSAEEGSHDDRRIADRRSRRDFRGTWMIDAAPRHTCSQGILPGGRKRPGLSGMEFVSQLVSALAWPVVVIVVVLALRTWITKRLDSLGITVGSVDVQVKTLDLKVDEVGKDISVTLSDNVPRRRRTTAFP